MADDVFDALESLRYNHELLVRDKKSLESCFEQESQEKDRLESILKSQNTTIRALLRNVKLQNRENLENIASIYDQLKRIGCDVAAPAASLLGCSH